MKKPIGFILEYVVYKEKDGEICKFEEMMDFLDAIIELAGEKGFYVGGSSYLVDDDGEKIDKETLKKLFPERFS